VPTALLGIPSTELECASQRRAAYILFSRTNQPLERCPANLHRRLSRLAGFGSTWCMRDDDLLRGLHLLVGYKGLLAGFCGFPSPQLQSATALIAHGPERTWHNAHSPDVQPLCHLLAPSTMEPWGIAR